MAFGITFPVIADTDFYGGISLGTTDNQSKSSSSGVAFGEDFNYTYKYSGDSTSYSIRGGYQFHENFAVEFGHYEYGKVTYAYIDEFDDSIKDKIDTNSNNLGVKGVWPITELISLNVSLGLAKWNFDANYTDYSLHGEVEKFSKDGTDMYYGVGFEYLINNSLTIGLEYSSLSMKWETSESKGVIYQSDIEHKVNSLSVVVQMKF
ncbi:MAG: outer membrane beta-barrel protein [Psychroserpens sp.]|nr:outer membrane beta-barrel protein [Psychroserpens sp.]